MADRAEQSDANVDIDTAHGVVTIKMTGSATDEALITLFDRLHAMPEFQAGFKVLFDATRIAETKVTADGVFRLARASQPDVNKTAIVVSAPVAYGMARMFEICADWKEDRVAVFSDMGAALLWLASSSG